MVTPSVWSRLLSIGAKVLRVGGALVQIAWPERTAVFECENAPGGCIGPASRPGDVVAATEVRLPQAGPTPAGGKEHRIKQDDGASPVQGEPVAQADRAVQPAANDSPKADDTDTKAEASSSTKRYRRDLSERQKALLRDAADPSSTLDPAARTAILETEGKRVPKGYEVSHEPPLYTVPPSERARLDKAEKMTTEPKEEHRERHKVGGDQYEKYGPPSDYPWNRPGWTVSSTSGSGSGGFSE